MNNFMEKQNLKSIVEAILFASDKPIHAGDVLKVIQRAEVIGQEENTLSSKEIVVEGELSTDLTVEEGAAQAQELDPAAQLAQLQQSEDEKLTRSDVQRVIDELVADYQLNADHGFLLVNVAHGFQFRTRPELSPYIKAMNKVSTTRLSQSALETLAMVAYRQPITRAEIEEMRGVDSGGVLKTLMDRDLVKIVGKKEEAGKPLLYGSTETFLEVFNLRGLQDLPTLKDLRQIEDDMRREAQAARGETLEVSEEFFTDSPSESIPSIAEQIQDLEREEAEAFAELDEQLKSLENVEKQVIDTFQQNINPPEEPTPEASS